MMKNINYLVFVTLLFQSSVCWFGSSEAETTTETPLTTTVAPGEAKSTEAPVTTTAAPEDVKPTEAPTDGEKNEEEHPKEEFIGDEEHYAEDGEENPLDSVDLYMYSVEDMSGQEFAMEAYRGYVTLVVNVASNCGYTDAAYKDLVALQTKFEPSGVFTVLAFPSNQFEGQEPGDNEEILKFATEKYNVNFPMFSKTEVSGDNATDAWHYLAYATGYAPQWNFWKYLVDQDGHVIDVWSHETPASELDGWIQEGINKALAIAEGAFTGEEYGDYDEMHEHDHAEL